MKSDNIFVSKPVSVLKKVSTESISVPVHAIYHDRSLYHNYPLFQRDFVWPKKLKRELIQSILQGYYIPSIIMVPVPPNEPGMWNVIDGQQRLSTIIQEMSILSGDTQRPTKALKNSFYYPLTEEEAKAFRSYPINFVVIKDYEPELLGEMFRRLQNQLPLTTGEKLYSYISPVTDTAKIISKMPYFGEIYTYSARVSGYGAPYSDKRKQSFQAALYCIAVQVMYPFGDYNANRMNRFADMQDVSKELCDEVIRIMGLTYHIFKGTKVHAMTEVLTQYLTTWILDFLGFDIENSEEGCLAEFYNRMKEYDKDAWSSGRASVFAGMANRKYQKEFFRDNLGKLVYSDHYSSGLAYRLTYDEVMANCSSFIGWLRHDGVCPVCHNQHIQTRHIHEHCFRPGQQICSVTTKLVESK